jgi:hypothetical protein
MIGVPKNVGCIVGWMRDGESESGPPMVCYARGGNF